ncbi:LuxR C-terminal-related transcriptional regulator [Rhodococcus rhodochrous]|uniref:LuxR C-terminal-related transcriptional regulator n=1 Tax=Rhodococcus rhodochrous TaxID=1829 RepID=A0AAW4XN67_RHORH|nr:LuxR C-terminal-related transcriptional regulator [Rhodococcus rhodochrous]MCD2114724.1 LuxR C-terminal-related transcriptional regulator [Rhodococcus rhodochrous]
MGDQDAIRDVLAGLRSVLDADDPSTALQSSQARAVVEQAWGALAEVLGEHGHDSSAQILAALRRLRALDQALLHAGPEYDSSDSSRRLGEALVRLEAAPCSTRALVELAPRLICDLGFDRAIISHVAEGLWVSESVFVMNDPDWAAAINRIGQEQPQPLVPDLFETVVVRRREPIVVTDVQRESRVHKGIADASMSRSYVAAPIVSRGRVVGLLHADRYGQDRETDTHDSELLLAFSHALRLALSRAQVTEQLEAARDTLARVSASLEDATAGVLDISLSLTGVRAGEPVDGPPRTRAVLARPATRPLPAELTSRELQVLDLMAEGRTNAAIAKELVISDGTVKQHVKHILRKLHARNRAEAIAMWFHAGRP